MNMQKYYGQLIGSKIIGFKFEEDEWGGDDWPIFTLQLGNQKVQLTLSQDPEGNGGGFAFIEEVK